MDTGYLIDWTGSVYLVHLFAPTDLPWYEYLGLSEYHRSASEHGNASE